MGAQWEKVIEFDTGSVFPENDFYREFLISAWTQPVSIQLAGGRTIKKIIFTPVRIRVVPKKYAGMLQNPLQSLTRLMSKKGKGNVNEVFCAAMLLEGQEKAMGIEILITAMEASERWVGRAVIGLFLQQMTGAHQGEDPKNWRKWQKAGSTPKSSKSDKRRNRKSNR